MLVLSRKVGQALIIGNDVVVRVLEVRGQQIRIGVEAPADVSVVREELHRAVAEANQEAAQQDVADVAALASVLRGRRPATER
jgi:carbon storage regulator